MPSRRRIGRTDPGSVGVQRRPLTRSATNTAVRARRVLGVAIAGILVAIAIVWIGTTITTPQGATPLATTRRTTPLYDPPVLAGQRIPGYCSAGVYARHGELIVLTSSPHCGGDGTVVDQQGVVGPMAQDATCPHVGYTCHASDMNYLVVALDRIPWGHLNLVDMGVGGYRVLEPGTRALGCPEVAIGDPVELDGRNLYRTGTVTSKGQNLQPPAQDGSFFPCMIRSSIQVGGGDSGGIVLDRGIPAGVTSRTFDGDLGFTPLAEGLADLGLEICTTPDCGLGRPTDPESSGMLGG